MGCLLAAWWQSPWLDAKLHPRNHFQFSNAWFSPNAVWWEPWCQERKEETCPVPISRAFKGLPLLDQLRSIPPASWCSQLQCDQPFSDPKMGRWPVSYTHNTWSWETGNSGDVGLNRSNSTVCSQSMAQRWRAMIKFILMVNKQGQTRLAWSLKGPTRCLRRTWNSQLKGSV